jgi:hypothetical protein
MNLMPAPAAPSASTALWSRIAAHSFEPEHLPNFARRLAREQRWSAAFTSGAIAEYRRFCFLAVTAPQPVTPSEEVDEVWHLHLLHSRHYWDIWCGQVLQTALHHDPTPGGAAALAWHREQYAQTLLAYEQTFGPPPEAYWPATHRRFAPRRTSFTFPRWLGLPRPWSRA